MPSGIYKRTEEHGHKISKARKGWVFSEETKRRMSKPHRSYRRMHLSEEHRKKLSEIGKRRKMSNETKRKMSETHRQKGLTGEKSSNWKGGISKNKKHLNELAKQYEHKRRAFKKQTSSSYTLGEWELLKKQYGYRCPLCGKKEPEITLTIDHIIPLSKGGSNYIENIQPLCKPCNSKKYTGIFRITPKGELMLF